MLLRNQQLHDCYQTSKYATLYWKLLHSFLFISSTFIRIVCNEKLSTESFLKCWSPKIFMSFEVVIFKLKL
jgi:hypothetical protein